MIAAADFAPGKFEEWTTYPLKDKTRMQLVENQAPKGWKCTGPDSRAQKDTTVKYQGDASLKLTLSPNSQSEFLFAPCEVTPGAKYTVSYRVKGENVVTKSAWCGMQASSQSKTWPNKKGALAFVRKFGTFDWTEYRQSFTARPDDKVAMVRILVSPGTGTLWFDDINITVEPAAK